MKKVLKQRLAKEERQLQKIYRLNICFRRMNRVQSLDEAKDPAVALLLENLKRDVVTAKRKYDAAVTKEVERLQQITNQADVEKYMKKKTEA